MHRQRTSRDNIAAAEPRACQPEICPERWGPQTRQCMRSTNVREKSYTRLRHRKQCAFSCHSHVAVYRQPYTATHDNTFQQ